MIDALFDCQQFCCLLLSRYCLLRYAVSIQSCRVELPLTHYLSKLQGRGHVSQGGRCLKCYHLFWLVYTDALINKSTLTADREKKISRLWAEHFNIILIQPISINNKAINRLPQVPTNEILDNIRTLDETRQAIYLLSSGKEPGSDSILAEI